MTEPNRREELLFVDRKNTHSSKWDNLPATFGADGLQAMWVADMDFKAPLCVREALQSYLDLGVFGYYVAPASYFEAFIQWEREQHGYSVRREWLRVTPGVVPAVNWFVQLMTQPGDAVLVLTPVYYPFMDAVKNNGRQLVCCDLHNENGVYTIDFAALEETLRTQQPRALVFSSPHNPVGRVWTREELRTLLDLCRKYGVFVISDEIHQDITFPDHEHIPSATVGDYDDMLVTLTAATKTFNLAGLQNSLLIIPDAAVRARYDEYVRNIRVTPSNPMGYTAVEAAYRGGHAWAAATRELFYANYTLLRDTLAQHAPRAVVSPLEGTYLAWIDLGAYVPAAQLRELMQQRCGLAVDYGDWFGGEHFGSFIRVNLATSRELVQRAADALVRELNR